MNQLYEQMNERKAYLEKMQSEITKELEKMPSGKLRINNVCGIPRYYRREENSDTRGKYIGKGQYGLVQQLAQKNYMEKLNKKISLELNDINRYLIDNSEDNLEKVYTSLNSYRKKLVNPIVIPDDVFVKQWESEEYKNNQFYPEQKVYPTKKDENVRSKSEVMIADMYYELGIPYRYEAALKLKNGKVRYPDFTILNIRNREVIYHEHFGLMDDNDYIESNLVKLEEYKKSGIYPGKNLIITYEADGCFLNIKDVRKMVLEILRIM